MSKVSLEAAIQSAGSAVRYLRDVAFPAFEFPVAPEFTDWISEQAAWKETCVLLDQSHHMSDLFITGPDAGNMLRYLGVNSFENFGPGRAKQYVVTNEDGYFIGDSVLFHLEEGFYDLVSNPSSVNWVQFHAETGDWNVTVEREANSARRQGPPRFYRYELQGPNALSIMQTLIGGPVPDIKFFHMTRFVIAGHAVWALRHGMAGQPGFELIGPWADGADVMAAILQAGEGFGLLRGGAKAYAVANLESAWIPRPPSAVFGPKEKAFREWLPAEAVGSLGGSMDSEDIADYYVTPFDIGYGRLIKFDHDFIGRDALAKMAENPRRTKVSLEWNIDDVMSVQRSLFEPGLPAKYIALPKSRYAFYQTDKVLHDGKLVGISMDLGHIANERAFISLATIDRELSTPGTEVVVVWGEKPNSKKLGVEPHRQVEIRATVAPAPYVSSIRESYRK
ncbi:MAG: aminomethyl transferase family protein [Gammaproteobacteria bacterium]|nr:aminomethyl transferase family protein [Gammaproteobacteria bacterium]